MGDSAQGDRPEASRLERSMSVPAWLHEILDRMRAENPDLFDADGRPVYDPNAPGAEEKGARILHAFGSAALAQLARAIQDRLKTRPGADATQSAVSDQEFRDELTALLTQIVQDLRGTLQRNDPRKPSATPEVVREDKDAEGTGPGRSDRDGAEVARQSDP